MRSTPVRAESSALISLEELLLLEQSRIRGEEAQRRVAEEHIQRARLEAEAKAQEAERARLRAEAENRRETERLDEARRARIEAEGLATLAAARMHAESAAKVEMMQVAHRQAQELESATARSRASAPIGRIIAGILTLASLGTLGLLLARAEARANAAVASLAGAEQARDEEEKRLSGMVPHEERDALIAKVRAYEAELDVLRTHPSASTKSADGRGSTAVVRGQPKPPARDPCASYRKLRETNPHDPRLFDPTNGCL